MSKNIDLIVLDMDGVLVDQCHGIRQTLGLPKDWVPRKYDFFDEVGTSPDQFWAMVECDPTWWLRLPPMSWFEELWKLCERTAPIIVATKPVIDPACAEQKIRWLYKHVGYGFRDFVVSPRKTELSGPKRLLIDDCDNVVADWIKKGGQAITMPRPYNQKRDLVGMELEYVMKKLEILR